MSDFSNFISTIIHKRVMNEPSESFRVEQIDHVELLVPSRQKAAAWYERVLGLKIVQDMAFFAKDSGGPLMISSDGGNTKIALFRGIPSMSSQSSNMVRLAFRVTADGFFDFLKHIENVAVYDKRNEPVTRDAVVDHEICFSIYFSDPWGTPLEVTSYDYSALKKDLAFK